MNRYNSNFSKLVESCYQLIREDAPPPEAPAPVDGAPPMDGMPMDGAPQPEAAPSNPASPGYTYLANLIFAALRVPAPTDPQAIKFSDNDVRDSRQAMLALKEIEKNIPMDVMQNIKKVGGTPQNDLDGIAMIEGTKLALKALFLPNKAGMQGDIASLTNMMFEDNDPSTPPRNIPPEKAKEMYEKFQSFLAVDA